VDHDAAVAPALLVGGAQPEATAVVAPRTAAARVRSTTCNGGRLNGRLRGRRLRALCRLDVAARRRAGARGLGCGERSRTERLLRVA
jgi:hypothetical protein